MRELSFTIIILISSCVQSIPQLDLPPVPITPPTPPRDIKPTLQFNSYSDRDRSVRFGPPYDDDMDEYDKGHDTGNRSRTGSGRENYAGSYYNDERVRDDQYYRDRGREMINDERLRNDQFYRDRGRGDDCRPNCNRYDGNYRNTDRYNDNYRGRDPGSYQDRDRYNQDSRNPQYYDRDNDYYNRSRYPGDDYNYRNRYGSDSPYSYNERDRYNRPNYGYEDPLNDPRIRQEMENLKKVLAEIDKKSSLECSINVAAQWEFETNVNEATHAQAIAAQQRYSDFQRLLWEQMKQFDQSRIYDNFLYRQVRLMSIIGTNALPPDQLDRYNRIVNDMLAIFNSADICAFEQPFKCGLKLQPHLKTIMAKSRDWDELQFTWIEFRRKTGRDMRELFEQMVDLTNEAANANNFTNGADYWMSAYDSPTFRSDMEQVWTEIEPLYELIHSYVRRKLREFYGPDKINRHAPIPDHILGNMYGQSWSNILDITLPYPGRRYLEVTPEMLAQGYNPLVMFQLADEFFKSLNMTPLPPEFWINSVLEQPPNRPVLCQPSAWDFCNGQDYRIKMCTQVNHKDLITAHHEVAHLHYFFNYKMRPKVFRDGPNPSFHEAIGDAIGLSVASPRHLQSLGLVQKSVDDTAHDINFLFALAMDKVVFLPFALALEFWRYDIFSKRIRKEQYNCHWWLLREQYGGIKPPVLRSELDFDMGSKYHVPANIPYMRHFFGTVLQFQIFRSLCMTSREYDPLDPNKPLHKCDIYRHPEAGDVLKRLMERGSSDTWQTIIQEVLGEGRLDASALREYFRPLEEWLRSENLRTQEVVGWRYDGDYCKHSIETANLQVYGGFYNNANQIRFTKCRWLVIVLTLFIVL